MPWLVPCRLRPLLYSECKIQLHTLSKMNETEVWKEEESPHQRPSGLGGSCVLLQKYSLTSKLMIHFVCLCLIPSSHTGNKLLMSLEMWGVYTMLIWKNKVGQFHVSLTMSESPCATKWRATDIINYLTLNTYKTMDLLCTYMLF